MIAIIVILGITFLMLVFLIGWFAAEEETDEIGGSAILAFVIFLLMAGFCVEMFVTKNRAAINMENTLQQIHEGQLEIYRESYSVVGDKITDEVYKVRSPTNTTNKVEN